MEVDAAPRAEICVKIRWLERTSTSERSLRCKNTEGEKGSAEEEGLRSRREREGCLGNSCQHFSVVNSQKKKTVTKTHINILSFLHLIHWLSGVAFLQIWAEAAMLF